MFSAQFAANNFPSGSGMSVFTSSNQMCLLPKVCFICATLNHKMGVRNCPEAQSLLCEELVKFCESTGSLIWADGTPLLQGTGNIATILWQEKLACETLKGKARDRYDHPPHMASNSSCVVHFEEDYSDKDVDDDDKVEYHPMFQSNTLTWNIATATQSGKSYEDINPPISGEWPKSAQPPSLVPPPRQHTEVPNRQSWVTSIPPQNTELAWSRQCSEHCVHQPPTNSVDNNKKFFYVSHMQKSINAESVLEHTLKSTIQIELGELLGVSTDL